MHREDPRLQAGCLPGSPVRTSLTNHSVRATIRDTSVLRGQAALHSGFSEEMCEGKHVYVMFPQNTTVEMTLRNCQVKMKCEATHVCAEWQFGKGHILNGPRDFKALSHVLPTLENVGVSDSMVKSGTQT